MTIDQLDLVASLEAMDVSSPEKETVQKKIIPRVTYEQIKCKIVAKQK